MLKKTAERVYSAAKTKPATYRMLAGAGLLDDVSADINFRSFSAQVYRQEQSLRSLFGHAIMRIEGVMEYRMSWMPFVDNCRKFFDDGKVNSLYPLMEAIDELYCVGPQKSPFLPPGAPGDEQRRIFAQCFFVCHRTFLSAATATGSGLPEDGEAITRRALEAARMCLAIKVDPANLEAWLSAEKRLER
jgi:hypothetical protein